MHPLRNLAWRAWGWVRVFFAPRLAAAQDRASLGACLSTAARQALVLEANRKLADALQARLEAQDEYWSHLVDQQLGQIAALAERVRETEMVRDKAQAEIEILRHELELVAMERQARIEAATSDAWDAARRRSLPQRSENDIDKLR